MSYKYFWKRSHICTHLVIQLSRAEGEFNVIVITRQFLSCHLYRGGWGGVVYDAGEGEQEQVEHSTSSN